MFEGILPLFSRVMTPDWTVTKDISYGFGPDRKLDLYRLNRPTETTPTILFIHGGGWEAGSKSAYEGRAKMFALAGFNVVSMDYTLATSDPATQWPAQYYDVVKAILWIQNNGLRKNKLIICGDSAGGHLALFSATAPEHLRPDGVINWFGPCDLTTTHMRSLVETLWVLGKKTFDEVPWIFQSASPIDRLYHAEPCPTLLIHGTEDTIVEYKQSQTWSTWSEVISEVPSELITYKGGHELDKISRLKLLYLEMRSIWWALRMVK